MLSSGRIDAAVSWARRGFAPLVVGTLDGWTVVAPAGTPMARPPYDDPVRTLAGRPVGVRMRPAIGVFRVGRQAVMTIHTNRWRAVPRWLVWTTRDGLVHLPGFAAATPADLVAAAGTVPAGHRAAATAEVARVWTDGASDAITVLTTTLAILGLPGAAILDPDTDPLTDSPLGDPATGARRVVPKERFARAFDRVVQEEERYADDLQRDEAPPMRAPR